VVCLVWGTSIRVHKLIYIYTQSRTALSSRPAPFSPNKLENVAKFIPQHCTCMCLYTVAHRSFIEASSLLSKQTPKRREIHSPGLRRARLGEALEQFARSFDSPKILRQKMQCLAFALLTKAQMRSNVCKGEMTFTG